MNVEKVKLSSIITGCVTLPVHRGAQNPFGPNTQYESADEKSFRVLDSTKVAAGSGMRDHDESWLQRKLNDLGASPPLIVDGHFGAKSIAALEIFQRNNGLPCTGLPDEVTIAALVLR